MLDPRVNDALGRARYALGLMQTMAERIRALRIARGLSQQQLAEKCGVTKGAVSQWELALTENIKLPVFLALCEVLGTDPHYLVFGPDRAPGKASKKPA
jgi:transcriptional regulator with XRE-family HTH domain